MNVYTSNKLLRFSEWDDEQTSARLWVYEKGEAMLGPHVPMFCLQRANDLTITAGSASRWWNRRARSSPSPTNNSKCRDGPWAEGPVLVAHWLFLALMGRKPDASFHAS